jgi:hypothetical protein
VNFRRLIPLAALIGTIPSWVGAQRSTSLDSVNRYVAAEMKRQRIPGASVAIERICYVRGSGFSGAWVVSLYYAARGRLGFIDFYSFSS